MFLGLLIVGSICGLSVTFVVLMRCLKSNGVLHVIVIYGV